MDCLITLTIAALMPVYSYDRATPTAQLFPNDRVCVLDIGADGWHLVHFSRFNIGYGGYIHAGIHMHTDAMLPLPVDTFTPPAPGADSPSPGDQALKSKHPT